MTSNAFSSPQVVCRPALPRDAVDVAEFCKGIWDGHDYVPQVWDIWAKDPNGLLVVAEYGGHVIGCAKVTLLGENQWWMEGFRVDPQRQGMRVGSQIHGYINEWWDENGDGVVRLMTNAKNYHVHHLCEKLGYKKIGEAIGYVATPLAEPINGFRPANDLAEAAEFAMKSEMLQVTRQICDFGWRIAWPKESVLKSFSNPSASFLHQFFWWQNKRALVSIWDDEDDDEHVLGIGLVACDMKDLPALLLDIRRLAAEKECNSIFYIAFLQSHIVTALGGAGYTLDWENPAYLYEKQHANNK